MFVSLLNVVLQKKCEQYWPSEGSLVYGDVTVELLDVAEYTDYIVRTFTLSVVGTLTHIVHVYVKLRSQEQHAFVNFFTTF